MKNYRKKKINELKHSFDVFSLVTMYFIFIFFIFLFGLITYVYSDDILIFIQDIIESQIYLNY
jgi:hypothetical protein